ncbi:hypothetical protein ACFSJ3_14200 [Corallincola platygyrae]|uniref:Uncharacterized protein n=1 Tax=Corallincola platygyrae TaxID=1193278 RepID=A0ABW4XPU7_9GAMM
MLIEGLLITSILGSIQDLIVDQYTQSADAVLKTEVVEHNGEKIVFTHQLWRIRDKSVCQQHLSNSLAYYQCRQQAANYFMEACQYLNSHYTELNHGKQIKNMYCNAATQFNPKVAQISFANEKSDAQKLKEECNVLVAQALNSKNRELHQKRDEVCQQYRELTK